MFKSPRFFFWSVLMEDIYFTPSNTEEELRIKVKLKLLRKWFNKQLAIWTEELDYVLKIVVDILNM